MVENRDDGRVAVAMQDLDVLLDGIGRKLASSPKVVGASTTAVPSGRVYTAITRYWPRIAASLVGLAVVVEWAVGGLTSSSRLESYAFAWATATGGLWFLFDKAEKTLGEGSRLRVVDWVRGQRIGTALESIPAQFAWLFDRVFGERHLSARCFLASSAASLVSVAVVCAAWFALAWPMESVVYAADHEVFRLTYDVTITGLIQKGGFVLALGLLFNVVPDFVSLLETRLVLRWMGRTGSVLRFIALDLVLTTLVSLGLILLSAQLTLTTPAPGPMNDGSLSGSDPQPILDLFTFAPAMGRLEVPILVVEVDAVRIDLDAANPAVRSYFEDVRWDDEDMARRVALNERRGFAPTLPFPLADPLRTDMSEGWSDALSRIWGEDVDEASGKGLVTVGLPFGIFFYTAFFTSAWLWLYAASLLVSRALSRMNNGVGFLLSATDVEKHPLRSIGFVSVIIVSGLFLLGLPLVLL